MSPTQLTLRELRRRGFVAAVTERWNPHARIRQDLFGFVDVLAIGPGGTIAVQATSDSNLASRVRKISDHENIGAARDANWTILVWGWKKQNNRWQFREVDVS